MRKVILQEFLTLDGLAAGPNDNVDYVPAATEGDKSFGQEQLNLMDSIDTILLGRVTYQMFAGYWPNIRKGKEKAFADKLNSIPKIVFSSTLDRAPWGDWEEAKVVSNSAVDEIKKLKQQKGKNMIIWGSISLAQSAIRAALIDEYRLVICPVVLGSGRPLFLTQVDPFAMKLLETESFDLGAVQLKYKAAATEFTKKRGKAAGA